MSPITLLEKIKEIEAKRGKPFGATVLKIDAEGAESEILENGEDFIEQRTPTIIAEATEQSSVYESVQRLMKLGYELVKVHKRHTLF